MIRRDSSARKVLALICALLILGPPPAPLASSTAKNQKRYPAYVIGAGDLLSITVYGERELPSSFLVDSDGSISYPFLGEVKVDGFTQGQASQRLERMLASYLRAPQVTVLIQETNSYTISVLGEVGHPGKFRIRGIPTLVQILAEAGGPRESADLRRTVLIRDDKKTLLNLERLLWNLGTHDPQPVLYPGDAIVVPRNRWPSLGEWGIIISILASSAVLATTVENMRNRP